jgi:hypothetical protein
VTAAPDFGRLEQIPEGMSRRTRVLAVLFIVLSAAFWAFAFSPWARDIFQAPDQIEDEGYLAAIELTCAGALDEIGTFPSPRSATGPEDRATLVENTNAVLQQMQADLAALNRGTDADRELVIRWLDDWDFYLEDRVDHVERLQTEGDVRFLNTERDGIFIAERMSGFARVNEIRSCMPLGDL